MSAAIRRLRRPWTVLSRAWGSFAPTAHNPMGGICPCGPNKRLSGRLSSRTRKLVRAGRHSPSTEAVGRFRLRLWRSCPRRTPRPPSHSSTAGMSYRIRSAFFPKRKFYGQANRACITCNTYSVPYKGKTLKKTPFSKMTEYTDTSVYYILYFPYFPVPQPVEKCIQLQLIQTELDPVIGVTTPCLVTIRSQLSLFVFSQAPKRPHRRRGWCYTPKP